VRDKYRVDSVITVAGMSTVYLVEQLMFREKMAMKVMSWDCARDKALKERFETEARIMRQLQSKFGRNIVKVEDIGETEDGLPYVVLEYVPGEPLSKIICPDDTPESRQRTQPAALSSISENRS
jgi:serine/threonine-protein kinase